MKQIKIQIANKQYTVKLAETDAQKETGLQNITSLPENSGMLFVFDEPEEVSFWMKDTKIPLDIIFIDDDLVVTAIAQGTPNSEEFIEGVAAFVLEVNQGSGIQIGDELEFEPENKAVKKSDKMLVLNSGGEVQMELEGGERIFSRSHTKTLIKFAKKAASTGNDNDYRALGKRMFKFLQVQSETKPEYVESKN